MKSDILLEVKNLTMVFPGIIALKNVNLEILEGEIHGIIGENGAGKSTLCNIITGVYQPTEGEIYLNGNKVNFRSPEKALDAGIRMVYQERNLIPSLTGAQNIYLGNEMVNNGKINEREIMSRAYELKSSLGIEVQLDKEVSNMSAAERQLIEIMRALSRKPKLLILDEPTSSIGEREVKTLFQVLKKIKEEGTSIIFISHKIDEILGITDRLSIFRDGENVFTAISSSITEKVIIKHMISRNINQIYPTVIPQVKTNLLEVTNLSDGNFLHDINITVQGGEVVGFYGLVGSGRTELAEMIFGLTHNVKGQIRIEGNVVEKLSPSLAIKNGILFTPEDRQYGLFDFYDIKKNTTMPYIKDRLSGFMGAIKLKKEEYLFQEIAQKIKLVYKNSEQSITELSGGNKQKIIIGKYLINKNMKLFIMDEPTQGIDIGTKYEIYILMRELIKNGVGVIFISSELHELMGVTDRLYVLKNGSIVAELSRKQFDKEKILSYAL